jgi:DNA-binding NarL/FixJ family response regulator
MGASVRRGLPTEVAVQHRTGSNGHPACAGRPPERLNGGDVAVPALAGQVRAKIRVLVAAENRLLREALARTLTRHAHIEVVGLNPAAPPESNDIPDRPADVLLLSSRGSADEDLNAIQQARACLPDVPILLIGMAGNPAEFLQCVRAGINGYLLRDASADEVLSSLQAIHAGEAVCPGSLCAKLFRYFAHEASALPCGSVDRRLGLTRREQQLVPLIAQGLTNKEIANHFSLSEQTIKNHLYRMKHRIGARDRLDIVQLYRVQGFLI